MGGRVYIHFLALIFIFSYSFFYMELDTYNQVNVSEHADIDKALQNQNLIKIVRDQSGPIYWDNRTEKFVISRGLVEVVFIVEEGEATIITGYLDERKNKLDRKKRYSRVKL